MNQNYIFYGTQTNAQEVRKFIEYNIHVNHRSEENGKKRVPLCVWGTHGIGKTELIESIAKENNYKFAYIAPAQFEEMGDLTGMPQILNNETHLIAPEWVPKEEGPGILLIDDVNRADDRILRGIMQLLQNYELVSWKLPKKWQIILTANPDGGDYSVTSMDDAMLTRMMHITMNFDAKEWSKWAEQNQVDSRGINFVLTYPEVISGKRTTPRTLAQFFESIKPIEDLKEELPLVMLLANSALDKSTAQAFVSFINNSLANLISPEEILNTTNFKVDVLEHLTDLCIEKSVVRADILSTLCTRMVNYIALNNLKLMPKQSQNLIAFLKLNFIPNDLRLLTLQEIASQKNSSLKSILAEPDLGRFLLNKM